MDCKKLIIDMIQEMKNNDFIRMIYYFSKVLYEKEKAPEEAGTSTKAK